MSDDAVFIAIDPGKNGGIAWKDKNGVQAIAMPDTVLDLVDVLRGLCVRIPYLYMDCVIERVHAMPCDGSASAFAFGENFGVLQGVLATLGIPYRFVTPQVWQKKVGSLPKDKKERKNALKAFAQQRYPGIKVTLKTSDALAMLTVESKI
jgi:hypothetical protein